MFSHHKTRSFGRSRWVWCTLAPLARLFQVFAQEPAQNLYKDRLKIVGVHSCCINFDLINQLKSCKVHKQSIINFVIRIPIVDCIQRKEKFE